MDATARTLFYDLLLADYTEHPRTIIISTPDQVVTLGNISNRKSAVPAIPLTGGSAATTYLIAGGILLGITAPVVMIQARKRRRALDS